VARVLFIIPFPHTAADATAFAGTSGGQGAVSSNVSGAVTLDTLTCPGKDLFLRKQKK